MPRQNRPHKIIRDIVHGYVPLTENDIYIIDTPYFQRLKRIRQTGAQSVYPSANHTRFEHSIGVMYLASKVLNVLQALDSDLDERLQNTVRYSCLLHDVGHAPFSHLGEVFFMKGEFVERINSNLQKLGVKSTILGKMASPHELCSCAVALEKFGKLLLRYSVDLDLFCRMITGEKYNIKEKVIEDCLIGILNSDIDVDKLDYVLRDAFMSGAELIAIDIERLLSAYTLHNDTIAFSGKALSTIASLVHGRNALYTWVYNHHITVYTDCLLRRLVGHLTEKIPKAKESLFSFQAIADRLVDDYDLIAFVRRNLTDDKARTLYNQLFNRTFYKSLWKTVFEFENLIEDPVHQDDFIRLVGQFRKEEGGLEELERRIIEADGNLAEGDFYIAVAEFKPFVPVIDKVIYIVLGNKRKRFQEIFQENIYRKPHRELPYIFVRDSRAREILLEKLNRGRLF